MSVGSAVNLVTYVGNASTVTAYSVPFRFDDSDWLIVISQASDGTSASLTEGVDYALTGDGTASEAELTTTAAIPVSSTLTIARYAPAFQLLDFETNAPLDPEVLETAFDRLVMALQDRMRDGGIPLAKALSFPLIEPASHETQLPLPHLRKDAVIYFDATTGEMELLTVTDLIDRAAAVIGELDTSIFAKVAGDNAFTGDNSFSQLLTLAAGLAVTGTSALAATNVTGKLTVTGQVALNVVTLTDAASIAWDASAGNLATLAMAGNRTLANPTNIAPGTYILLVASGGNTLDYGTNFRFPGGTVPTLSATADILTFVNFGGSELYLVAQSEFQAAP